MSIETRMEDNSDKDVGPSDKDIKEMLATIGCSSLDDLISKTIPNKIIRKVSECRVNGK